jgi:hypothetical protein
MEKFLGRGLKLLLTYSLNPNAREGEEQERNRETRGVKTSK